MLSRCEMVRLYVFFFFICKKFFSFPTNFFYIFLLRAAFTEAAAFNSDVSSWDVSNVVDFTGMLSGADSFNSDVSAWNVAAMSEAVDMFAGTDAFVLGSWCSAIWAASPYAGVSTDNGDGSVKNRIFCCPAGRYLRDAATDDCHTCDAGKYQNEQSLVSSCRVCARNHIAPTRGLSACAGCYPGRFSNQNRETCNICAAGQYRDDNTYQEYSQCIVCLAGTYQELSDGTATSCKDCPAGFYIHERERPYCLPCKFVLISFSLMLQFAHYKNALLLFVLFFSNFFPSILSSGVPGTTNNISGQSDCTQCPTGKYMEFVQSTIPCKDCEAGKFVVFDQASSCTNCAPGKWSDAVSLATDDCKDCIIGKYSAAQGAKTELDCVDCPPGKYGVQAGEQLNELWSC